MNKEQKEFCVNHNLTENQFFGKEKISGNLYLRSVTSIPEGFNPTVGGNLDLESVTSIPQGFNPTVGGSLDLRSVTSIPQGFNPTVGGSLDLRSVTSIPQGFNPTVGGYLDLRSGLTAETRPYKNTILSWQKGKYISVDGMFTEVIEKKGNIYKVRYIGKEEISYVVTDGEHHAHGTTLAEAKSDLRFKKMAEKLKNEPIEADTLLTVQHYRLITGACDAGVRHFMQQNKIPFKVVGKNTVELNPIKAKELLPILEKNNAYGLDKFKQLLTF